MPRNSISERSERVFSHEGFCREVKRSMRCFVLLIYHATMLDNFRKAQNRKNKYIHHLLKYFNYRVQISTTTKMEEEPKDRTSKHTYSIFQQSQTKDSPSGRQVDCWTNEALRDQLDHLGHRKAFAGTGFEMDPTNPYCSHVFTIQNPRFGMFSAQQFMIQASFFFWPLENCTSS